MTVSLLPRERAAVAMADGSLVTSPPVPLEVPLAVPTRNAPAEALAPADQTPAPDTSAPDMTRGLPLRIEGRLVAERIYELTLGHGFHGRFDADHRRAIHRHLFQDIYEWAGHMRDERVPLSDGTIATEPVMRKQGFADFLIGRFIPGALDGFAKMVRDADYLRGLSRENFAARAADIMGFLNAIHPFREGNGRTQRIFLRELAQDAGHGLDFSVVSKERMIAASIAANDHDDRNMMRRLFNEISDASRAAALRQAIECFEQQGFPWYDRSLLSG